jgi:carbon-monoxide dehydrogenase medium subunit
VIPAERGEEGHRMIPAQFDYVRPSDLGEVLRILRMREGEAKILSGGYSLLPLLKLRLAEPALLVDIQAIEGLDAIRRTDDDFRIGSRVTHGQIAQNAMLASALPILAQTADGIGDPQVRNWGTIGGSCAHADPNSDWPAVLIALRASLVCARENGERSIPARDFFLDTFTTAIEPFEVLTEVRIPIPPRNSGAAYRKLERRAGDFSTVGAAVQVALGADGRIVLAGVGLTSVAETPFAATNAERELLDQPPSDGVIERAARAAGDQSRPVTDVRGPADYKRAMAAEMTARALRAALELARGAIPGATPGATA